VWFTVDHHLFEASTTTTDTPQAVLQSLVTGPTDEQVAAGVGSSIPAHTVVQSLSVQNGLARVQLSTHVESDPLSDAQVVFTLTQFPDIHRVLVNDQEGGPLSRRDLTSQLPAILVRQPAIGQRVTSPVTIAGAADVFEATVSIRILDSNGNELANTYTTASCGTGCMGDYATSVRYTSSQEQDGVIEVFEVSAENGRAINVVRIPVTLLPSTDRTNFGTTVWRPIDHPQSANTPERAALLFAHEIMGWDPARVHLETSTPGGGFTIVRLWNTDMTTTFTPDVGITLTMTPVDALWSVARVESGLFDVTCPSQRQDVIVTTKPDATPGSVPICGRFSQPPAGWVVTATVEYAGSDLHASEAQSSADIPITGRDFRGSIPLTASYAGKDVSVRIEVRSGSGTMLGIYARRFVTESSGASG
jgi:hypothetical protein